jgi:hypothetical protein
MTYGFDLMDYAVYNSTAKRYEFFTNCLICILWYLAITNPRLRL